MKGKRSGLVVGTILLCGLLASWATKRQQIVLQPCPFDPNLSVGVAFQGPHQYFHTGKVQEKTLHARIAWFHPIEEPNPDAFDRRVAEEPPEPDWDWWTTLYPTNLTVQVADSLKRLGSLEVWDFDTKLLDGILLANDDGSSVSGTLTLKEPSSYRLLVVKNREGKPLAKLLAKDGEIKLFLLVEVGGWIPHPPPRDVVVELAEEKMHEGGHPVQVYDEAKKAEVTENRFCLIKRWRAKEGCPPDTGFNDQHEVGLFNPIIFGPPPQGCSMLDTRVSASCGTWVEMTPFPPALDESYCMTRHFTNDSPSQITVSPPKDYLDKEVPVRLGIDLRSLAPIVAPEQQELLNELEKEQVAGTTLLTTPVTVPPYSKGCVHWDLKAIQPTVKGIWAVPYRKYKKTQSWFEEFVSKAVRILIPGIIGRAHPIKTSLALAAVEAWERAVAPKKEVEGIVWYPQDAKKIGDFWVLRLALARQGPMYPPQNITQDIKVQVVVVKPDGTKEAVDGSLSIERISAWTNPSPPMHPLPPSEVSVPKEGTTISLGKGWRWKLTAFSVGRSATKEISVPLEPPSVVIEVRAPVGMDE